MSRTCTDIIVFSRSKPEFSETRTAADRCVRGQPLQRTWNHFSGADGRFFAGMWQAEPGCWRVKYTEFEYFKVLEGQGVLRDADGGEIALGVGDDVVIPAGFEGEWEVIETMRKIYVIYTP